MNTLSPELIEEVVRTEIEAVISVIDSLEKVSSPTPDQVTSKSADALIDFEMVKESNRGFEITDKGKVLLSVMLAREGVAENFTYSLDLPPAEKLKIIKLASSLTKESTKVVELMTELTKSLNCGLPNILVNLFGFLVYSALCEDVPPDMGGPLPFGWADDLDWSGSTIH